MRKTKIKNETRTIDLVKKFSKIKIESDFNAASVLPLYMLACNYLLLPDHLAYIRSMWFGFDGVNHRVRING